MKRRALCVLLSALILISLVPSGILRVNAYENLTTSDACVELLKEIEGFLKYPVYDNGQYSIGYGSGCNPSDYPNGITEEEAEELLRDYLTTFEKSVNTLAKRYNLTFTQNEFDALVSFTYNVGGNWINSDGAFRQAVISKAKGNDFIYPFCLWSSAGGEMNIHLVRRRLIEANMYLNGQYKNLVPASYSYVVYENNGGIGDVKVQGYDYNLAVTVKPIPSLSGSRFLGWYTEDVGGSWVTNLTSANAATTLYAHWQQGSGDKTKGTAANYYRTINQLGSQSVYDAPGGKAVGTVESGSSMKIVADYVDGSNVKWGKREDGTWVNLGNPLIGIYSSAGAGQEVTVTGGEVNVRSGPGTTYPSVGAAHRGDKLIITETRMNGTDVWGKFEKGWICLRYTTYVHTPEKDTPTDEEDTSAIIATGVVIECDALRVRSGPGVSYPMVTSVNAGTRLAFTQIKTVGGAKWGKIRSGWVSLAYVKMDEDIILPDDDDTGSGSNSNGFEAYVNANGGLNIRSNPGTQYSVVGYYAYGTKVVILEQKTVNGVTWGRTNKGWVSMAYIKTGSAPTPPETTPPETTPPETTPPETTPPEDPKPDDTVKSVTGTVTAGLNVRAGAGTQYGVVNGYKAGDRVTILEQKTVNGMNWGRTDKGWICLAYVKLDSDTTPPGDGDTPPTPPPSGSTVTGTVISQTGLNIRSGAGTHYAVVGGYKPGDKVTILEQKTVNEVKWGRTNRGWISMVYIKLDSAGDTTPPQNPQQPEADTKTGNGAVISNSPLTIRSGPGTNFKNIGSYPRGTRVNILQQTTVKGVVWGQTDKGWICMDYVKMDGTANANYSVVVTASTLIIRDKAGTEGKSLGFYRNGERVTILKTTVVSGVEWGQTNKGWICLAYVKK